MKNESILTLLFVVCMTAFGASIPLADDLVSPLQSMTAATNKKSVITPTKREVIDADAKQKPSSGKKFD